MKSETTIALLIDCDNASHHAIEGVLNELAKYGVVNIRRAYGNWKSSHLRGWEEKLHPFAIVPIQQFCYTAGKNATDAAMIIDAMDLLYTHKPDAFALLTSDSDFTPLVMRLLTNGTRVFGFGEKKTPLPFVNACSQFIYTENLEGLREGLERTDGRPRGRLTGDQLRADTRLLNVLRTAAEQTTGDDGFSHLGRMAQYISNKTSFSPVNYGYKKVSDLIRATGLFVVELRNNGNDMYIRYGESPRPEKPEPQLDSQQKARPHHQQEQRPAAPEAREISDRTPPAPALPKLEESPEQDQADRQNRSNRNRRRRGGNRPAEEGTHDTPATKPSQEMRPKPHGGPKQEAAIPSPEAPPAPMPTSLRALNLQLKNSAGATAESGPSPKSAAKKTAQKKAPVKAAAPEAQKKPAAKKAEKKPTA